MAAVGNQAKQRQSSRGKGKHQAYRAKYELTRNRRRLDRLKRIAKAKLAPKAKKKQVAKPKNRAWRRIAKQKAFAKAKAA